ncbi:unnamed protein product [Urochloa humidicola]
MTTAVDVLARHQGTGTYDLPKSMLGKLVIMVCEGVRFHTVYGTLDREFDSEVAASIAELDGQQVLKWDRICKAVLAWGVDPTAEFPELVKLGVGDKNDAARIVALVKDA